ncbi:MAG TPA: glutathione synthase [Burkholderiaceae bacterium]|jgi:glutathione synthase|nr:glutathione synthase [Burkholderiaceae bacterium]
MRILVISDPLDQYKTYKDSTYAMMVESDRRDHSLYVCEQSELYLADGATLAQVRRLHLVDDAPAWYRLEEPEQQPLTAFDAVLMRKDPPFDMEYVYSTYLLEHAVRCGARVFNDPRAIRDHSEKLSIAEFPQFSPETLVTRDPARLRAFVDSHGQAVLKLLEGMGGASIFIARVGDPNLSVILETMSLCGGRSVMAQRYLPAIADGDKRVLLIGGNVVPYCLARIPKAGESRGNLAAGGTGVARPLSARDREIGEALAPVLAARGLLLVGLDVIGEHLTEINVTSPTCFQEITQQTGFAVAAMFVDALEQAVSGSVR